MFDKIFLMFFNNLFLKYIIFKKTNLRYFLIKNMKDTLKTFIYYIFFKNKLKKKYMYIYFVYLSF